MENFDNFHVKKVVFWCFNMLNARIPKKTSILNFLSSGLRAFVNIFLFIYIVYILPPSWNISKKMPFFFPKYKEKKLKLTNFNLVFQNYPFTFMEHEHWSSITKACLRSIGIGMSLILSTCNNYVYWNHGLRYWNQQDYNYLVYWNHMILFSADYKYLSLRLGGSGIIAWNTNSTRD